MNLTDNKEAELIKEFSDLQSIPEKVYEQSSFVKYNELIWQSISVSEYDFNNVIELGTLIENMWTDYKEDDRKKIAKICAVAAYRNRNGFKSNDTISEYNYIF